MFPDRFVFRRGLLFLADGIAIWFLAILSAAYSAGSVLPWENWTAFTVTAGGYTSTWIGAPSAGVAAAVAHVGIALIVVGPLTYWILIPNLGPRFDPLRRVLLVGMSTDEGDSVKETGIL